MKIISIPKQLNSVLLMNESYNLMNNRDEVKHEMLRASEMRNVIK